MMETKTELLEIYKLHVEMADRASNRRLQINRFYIVLLSGLLTLSSLLVQKDIFTKYSEIVLIPLSVLGIMLCVVWCTNIRSYEQLNSGKFKVIQDLEKQLSYAFYTKEWDLLEEGKQSKTYFPLTKIEEFLPLLMTLPYILLLAFYTLQLKN